jgi:hypothetical protein
MATKPQPAAKTLLEVSNRGTVTLPKAFRSTDLFEARLREDGTIELIPQRAVDARQAWFWSERWQQMERDADSDIAAGRVRRYDDVESLVDDLEGD